MDWVLWVLVACGFGVGELLTNGFFLAPFAVGGILAAVTEATISSEPAALLVFILASFLTLGIVRPIARRHLQSGPGIRTGTAALIGKQALVLERIANDDGVGAVKIEGEVWTARAFDDDEVIEAGRRVQVLAIKGATALVSE
ncbi:MAG: NfeD family protein [Solirubrobacteraceae bacterium]|jgi:membrane protein implicated in regulation of membrane protease activity